MIADQVLSSDTFVRRFLDTHCSLEKLKSQHMFKKKKKKKNNLWDTSQQLQRFHLISMLRFIDTHLSVIPLCDLQWSKMFAGLMILYFVLSGNMSHVLLMQFCTNYFYRFSCSFMQELMKYHTVCAVHMAKV